MAPHGGPPFRTPDRARLRTSRARDHARARRPARPARIPRRDAGAVAALGSHATDRVRPSQVRKQIEVAEILEKLDGMATRRGERERPVASPRAARLRELEDAPPKWLTEAIGRAPSRHKTSAYAVVTWPIGDCRRDHGWASKTDALGPQPTDPAGRRAHARASERSRRCGANASDSEACFANAGPSHSAWRYIASLSTITSQAIPESRRKSWAGGPGRPPTRS